MKVFLKIIMISSLLISCLPDAEKLPLQSESKEDTENQIITDSDEILSCTPGTIEEINCDGTNASLAKQGAFCNDKGDALIAFGSCIAENCLSGFDLVQGKCESQQTQFPPTQIRVCSVGQTQTIDCKSLVPGAIEASQDNTCAADGMSYIPGFCQVLNCSSDKKREGNKCVEKDKSVTPPIINSSRHFFVKKSGNDSNGCSNNTDDACLTIQKGISLVGPGDTLNIGAGVYRDDGGRSIFKPAEFCGWLDSRPTSSNVCIRKDGTALEPITIRAYPGMEGDVIVDGEGVRLPIHLGNSDYIHIKGLKVINAMTIGIASWGQPENSVADDERLSIGCVIDNNIIETVRTPNGMNGSAIGVWGTKDWVVTNNKISDIYSTGGTLAAGIQAYGVINILIKNNHFSNTDFGIYWKDHFVSDLDRSESLVESEISHNVFEGLQRGFYIAGGYEEAGQNFIHHNIFRDYSEYGVYINHQYRSSSYAAVGLRIENNLFDGTGNTSSTAIWNDTYKNTVVVKNIFKNISKYLTMATWSSQNKPGDLSRVEGNIFYPKMGTVRIDAPSGYSGSLFTTLSSWQEAQKSNYITLSVDQPDFNSIEVDTLLDDTVGVLVTGEKIGPRADNDRIGLLKENEG